MRISCAGSGWFLSLADSGEIHAVKHNIMEPLPPNPEPFHFIIHAAGIASPIYYRAHPIETMDANVGGLRRLLDYCRLQKGSGHDVEGFLFFLQQRSLRRSGAEWIPIRRHTGVTFPARVPAPVTTNRKDSGKRSALHLRSSSICRYGSRVLSITMDRASRSRIDA
jgi:hypothetical protein